MFQFTSRVLELLAILFIICLVVCGIAAIIAIVSWVGVGTLKLILRIYDTIKYRYWGSHN